MNRILFALTFLVACSGNESKQQGTETSSLPASLPAGAMLENYNDETGISKVVVKEGDAIVQEGTLINGKREGNWIEYHTVGFVKSVTPYVNDMKEGVAVEITQNGQLAKRSHYHRNVLHGEYKAYLYSTIKEERVYSNDKIEGTAKVYYDNGKIMEEGNYKNGIRDGISKWYDQDGKVSIEYEYKDGQLVKK